MHVAQPLLCMSNKRQIFLTTSSTPPVDWFPIFPRLLCLTSRRHWPLSNQDPNIAPVVCIHMIPPAHKSSTLWSPFPSRSIEILLLRSKARTRLRELLQLLPWDSVLFNHQQSGDRLPFVDEVEGVGFQYSDQEYSCRWRSFCRNCLAMEQLIIFPRSGPAEKNYSLKCHSSCLQSDPSPRWPSPMPKLPSSTLEIMPMGLLLYALTPSSAVRPRLLWRIPAALFTLGVNYCRHNFGTRTLLRDQSIRGLFTACGQCYLAHPLPQFDIFRPDHCDGTYDANCDASRAYTNISSIISAAGQTDLLTYMNTYWKDYQGNDESFWEHEWGKHGTCISTLNPSCYTNYVPQEEVVAYFQKTVDLFKTLNSYQVRRSLN